MVTPVYSRDLLTALSTPTLRPPPGVIKRIKQLGCHRRRRGRRGGRPRDQNKNKISCFHQNIPVLIGRRKSTAKDNVTSARRTSILTTVRRHGNLDPVTVGLFNARSIHNKYVSIAQWIGSRQLNVAGLVETWHDAHDCPDLIACAPTGYSYVDRARPRVDPASLHVNHGGVALIYRNDLSVRKIELPAYKTCEVVGALLQRPSFSALTIVIYRPGSASACDDFFDDFADLLERISMYSNLLIIGYINLHLDVRSDPHTIKFQQLLDAHDLSQHVVGATHTLSHTLDILITRAEQTVNSCLLYTSPSPRD